MKSEVLRRYNTTITKIGLDDAAARAAMRSLLNLTINARDPTVYFNRVSIALDIPLTDLYGYVAESDVPRLLEPYVKKEYVKVARIRHRTGGKEHIGYRANLSKERHLKTVLSEKA